MEELRLSMAMLPEHYPSDAPGGADRFARKRVNDQFRWVPDHALIDELRERALR